MKKIIIKIPETKEELRNLTIRELHKGCRKRMEDRWRTWIKNVTFLGWKGADGHKKMQTLYPPFNCEFCKYVGTEFWHCHNPKSFKCYINVNRSDLCDEFEPNIGLILMLWYQVWLVESELRRNKYIEDFKNLKEEKIK